MKQVHSNKVIVEVRPDSHKGWAVTEIRTIDGHAGLKKVYGHYRLKTTATLVGKGAAIALACELQVTDRKGRYTAAGKSSYGHDPSEIRG